MSKQNLSYPLERQLMPNRLWWWETERRMVEIIDCDPDSALLGYRGDGTPVWNDDKVKYRFWYRGRHDSDFGKEPFRRPTKLEFLWYRDPQTRKRKVGLNPAWPFLWTTGLFVACLLALIAYGAPSVGWYIFMLCLILALPAWAIGWALSQYKTHWT